MSNKKRNQILNFTVIIIIVVIIILSSVMILNSNKEVPRTITGFQAKAISDKLLTDDNFILIGIVAYSDGYIKEDGTAEKWLVGYNKIEKINETNNTIYRSVLINYLVTQKDNYVFDTFYSDNYTTIDELKKSHYWFLPMKNITWDSVDAVRHAKTDSDYKIFFKEHKDAKLTEIELHGKGPTGPYWQFEYRKTYLFSENWLTIKINAQTGKITESTIKSK